MTRRFIPSRFSGFGDVEPETVQAGIQAGGAVLSTAIETFGRDEGGGKKKSKRSKKKAAAKSTTTSAPTFPAPVVAPASTLPTWAIVAAVGAVGVVVTVLLMRKKGKA